MTWLKLFMNPKILAGFGLILFLAFTHYQAFSAAKSIYKPKADAARAEVQKCLKEQGLSYNASQKYQSQLDDLNARLVELKRVRDKPACVPIDAAGGSDETTSGRHAGENGLRRGWLLDFAGECEAIRRQLTGLQNYIKGEE